MTTASPIAGYCDWLAETIRRAADLRRAGDLPADVVEPVEVVQAESAPGGGAPPCPNCGNCERTEDGDCSRCFDPCENAPAEVVFSHAPDDAEWWERGAHLLREALDLVDVPKARKLIREVIDLLEAEE